jgi:hypothetical protein
MLLQHFYNLQGKKREKEWLQMAIKDSLIVGDKIYCGFRLNTRIHDEVLHMANFILSLQEWCKQNNRLDLLEEWNYDLNGSPSNYGYRSNKRVSWI